MNITRPNRGVFRFDDLTWPVDGLQEDLARFDDADWENLSYGPAWKQVMVVRPEKGGGTWTHPKIAECPTIQSVFDAFPARILDASLASLAPGAGVGLHRDISGGTPMGVARFHVPIVSDPAVEFHVDGDRFFLAPGEIWNLDTTYEHKVHNGSDITRVHLIVDFELNDELERMMPAQDLRDRLHRVHFAAICAGKGAKLALKDPRSLATRVRKFVKLLVFKQSVLHPED